MHSTSFETDTATDIEQLFVTDFSLQHTLESAQFFSYELYNNWYYIVTPYTVFKVQQQGDILSYHNVAEDALKKFFSLDDDFKVQAATFSDDFLQEALQTYWGMRLISQDVWQALVSFICSSAATVAKITHNVKLLSQLFGDTYLYDGREFFLFPKPGTLTCEATLLQAKTGYRSRYLAALNTHILTDPQFLDELQTLPYNEAKEKLMQLHGVGAKVANCVCLFSLSHTQACPVDTWIKRIVEHYYLQHSATAAAVENWLQQHFGSYKGLKQQYLFHYARSKKKR